MKVGAGLWESQADADITEEEQRKLNFLAPLQAIRASSCYVDDISKANVVFLYDYCYYIWWLAHIHSALGEKVVGRAWGLPHQGTAE